MSEAAEWLALPGLKMVAELTDVSDSARTVFVGAARLESVEGIVHVLCTGKKRPKYFAKFTSDEEYRTRWSR